MGAGERRIGSGRRGREAVLEGVPLLEAAGTRTRRDLAAHAERLRLPAGAVVVERGRAVQWVAFPTAGALVVRDSPLTRWQDGRPVFLAEGLVHGVAPESVVTHGEAEIVHLPIRALIAAVSVDAGFGLAVARSLAAATASSSAAAGGPRRLRGFERRRAGGLPVIRPAA